MHHPTLPGPSSNGRNVLVSDKDWSGANPTAPAGILALCTANVNDSLVIQTLTTATAANPAVDPRHRTKEGDGHWGTAQAPSNTDRRTCRVVAGRRRVTCPDG